MEDDEDDGEDDERTLMTFKAHKGWVSAVRFLNDGQSGGGGANRDNGMRVGRLLSSANDSVVSLWDTSKQHRGVPRSVRHACRADGLHLVLGSTLGSMCLSVAITAREIFLRKACSP